MLNENPVHTRDTNSAEYWEDKGLEEAGFVYARLVQTSAGL